MRRLIFALPCLLFFVSQSFGQGLLIESGSPRRLPRPWIRPTPRPQLSYKIQSIDIHARVKDQVAQVQLSQTFVNTGTRQMEVQFVFPLPYDGAIDQLTLLVNGEEFPAQLLSKEEARKKYEAIVRASKDPALLEWLGQGLFQTSLFPVPPGEERTVTLHYNQVLRKDQGVTDFLFPFSTAKYTSGPVEKIRFQALIESTLPIKNIYSPTHDIKVKRSGKKKAQVSFSAEKVVPTSDLRLFFDVNPKKLGTSVLSYRPKKKQDGYFLLLTTPQVPEKEEQLPKTVLFVVDKSGSMSGEKIEQAKGALKFVLNNLRPGDLFNIIAYDSTVQSFKPELENYNKESRQAALGYIEGLYAGGGTNIHGALSTALGQLKDKKRPNYVIFLTDGLPTVGERNESKIAAAARKANRVRARILNFGVGYDVNSRLLDRLGRDNYGASEYVRPNEDIEVAISRVFNRIKAPVLTDVKVLFEMDGRRASDGKLVNRVYPSGTFDLFSGEQVVLVGRYKQGGKVKITIQGTVRGETLTFDFQANLAKKSRDQSFAFVEKLWAMRRIGEIIDALDLNGHNEELVEELVMLSTRHGILTPYTSFLADENTRPTELARSDAFHSNALRSRRALGQLQETLGREGVSQRAAKQSFKNADRPVAGRAAGFAPAGGGDGASLPPHFAGKGAAYRDAKTDKIVVTSNVRQVGQHTLYKRGKILCTSETADLFSTQDNQLKLDLDALRDQVQVIQRFSKEYFELTAANTADENQLLASQLEGEELLIKLRGQVYLIR